MRTRLAAVCLLLVSCMSREEADAARVYRERSARAWCDKMGVRVTGVTCNAYTDECTIAAEHITPFVLWCREGGSCELAQRSR